MTSSKNKNTFEWTDEITSQAISLYKKSGKDNGIKSLNTISSTIGAKSGHAVRSKLVREGEYVTVKTATKSGGTKLLKSQVVELIAKELSIEGDTLVSLGGATMASLKAILDAVKGK